MSLIYWTVPRNRGWYCGQPSELPPDGTEIPAPPGPTYVWNGSAWVEDNALSARMCMESVVAELARLAKWKLYNVVPATQTDLAAYLQNLSTYLDSGNYMSPFPTCPASLLDENFTMGL